MKSRDSDGGTISSATRSRSLNIMKRKTENGALVLGDKSKLGPMRNLMTRSADTELKSGASLG